MEAKGTKGDLNDILFENRNKNYGAYALRKSQDNSILIGLLISLTIVILMAGAPKFFGSLFLSGVKPVTKDTTQNVLVNLFEKKIEQPKQVIEPPVKPRIAKSIGNSIVYKPVDTLDNQKKDSALLALNNNNPYTGDPKGKDTISNGFKPKTNGGNGGGDPKKVILVPDKNPEFPGGLAALQKYLAGNIKYPQRAADDKVSGIVYLSFVVNEEGKIQDVKFLNEKIGEGLEDEAIRVVKSMPNWTPGVYQGENVPVLFKLPVKFKIK